MLSRQVWQSLAHSLRSCALPISSTACSSSGSNLERFIQGAYDPVSENQKKEDNSRGNERAQEDRRPPRRAVGEQARRQAIGFARERAQQNRPRQADRDRPQDPFQHRQDRPFDPARQSTARQGNRNEQQDPGRRQGPFSRQSRGPREAQEAPDVLEDEPDETGDSTVQDTRRSTRKPSRRTSTSMLGTISDDSALLSKRTAQAGASRMRRGSRPEAEGAGGPGEGQQPMRRKSFRPRKTSRDDDEGRPGRRMGAGRSTEGGKEEEAEAEWHILFETEDEDDVIPVKLPVADDGQTFTFDSNGITCRNDWDAMTLEQLRANLMLEMNYTREDHERWLRGPGRAHLEEARRDYNAASLDDPAEFEAEIELQMELFDRHTWVEDLYVYAKDRHIKMLASAALWHDSGYDAPLQALLDGTEGADTLETPKLISPEKNETASAAQKETPIDGDATQDPKEAPKPDSTSPAAAITASNPSEDASQVALADTTETSDAAESSDTELLDENAQLRKELERLAVAEGLSEEQLGRIRHDLLTADTRLNLREARMLRKFWAVREVAPVGIAPRRKGVGFSKREFQLRVLDKCLHFLDPNRPCSLDGSLLSERQAIDAERCMIFNSHPEMMITHVRPELFPASTLDRLTREDFEKRMESVRQEVCHPLAGIYDEDDWQQFKDAMWEELPRLLKEKIKMHQNVGFSGLMGGFQEERAYLEEVGDQFMPEEHVNRYAKEVFTDRIASNPQWPWQYKVKAVINTTKYLMTMGKFGEELKAKAAAKHARASTS